jgi:hypothetical protein
MIREVNKKGALRELISVILICGILITTSTTTVVVVSGDHLIAAAHVLSYMFEFKEPDFQPILRNGAEYTSLIMDGCIAVGQKPGDPMMPVKTVQLMLPPQKEVDEISVIGIPVIMKLSGINLELHPVIPYQKPIRIGDDQSSEWILNTDVYSSDEYYPSILYSNAKVGYSHGVEILSLTLNPLQYNPLQGTLRYYSEMTVCITLKNNPNVNILYRNIPEDLAYIKTFVSNPEVANEYSLANLPVASYPGGLCDPSEQYDYIIVTTTWNGLDHWDTTETTPYNWDNLLAMHNADGLSGTEVLVQDINACPDYWNDSYYPLFNDTQAKVREFCKDAYLDWGIQYILFGGDAYLDALPARLMDSLMEYGVDADIYWSNLDNNFNGDHDSQWGEEGDPGFDCYSELAIGRIPCESPQDVSNWLTKSFFYTDATDPDYLENAAFFGNNTILGYSAVSEFEKWNTQNPENLYNLSVQTTDVYVLRDAINADQVTLISGVAHADSQMSLDVYTSDWEVLYHNTKPFLIHDMGSHCGDFDAGNGVLDAMLFHSDTELAFGCVYNTGYGWANEYDTNASSTFQQKMFWDYFFDVENNSHGLVNWQLGKAQGWSKDQMAPMIDWWFGSWRETIQCCLLFGDPAQTIKPPNLSNPPEKPSIPEGPAFGYMHVEYSYTTSTTDPDGDSVIYLFDWGDGTNSGWLPNGEGSHCWNELGSYAVKAKARDIWGAVSQWSDPLTVVISDNTPPSIPTITGPSSGKPGTPYLFNIQSVDPQGQNIYYYVDWGDDSNSLWLGPYASGTTIHITHVWDTKGTYSIKAKAKDTSDLESDWGTLPITIPFSYEPPQWWFIQLVLQWFPHAFPLLRLLFS